MTTDTRPNVSYGDATLAKDNEILRTVVGSDVHGMAIQGTDDRDYMGICIEPPAYVCGLEVFEQHVFRTQPEGARSGPGDIDLTIYSLRKWMRMAVRGNPTVLLPLYAPADAIRVITPLGIQLRELAGSIVSFQAGWRFLGYLDAQRDRVAGGGKRNRVPKRPELIERHGYDVKFASHALRLGRQGVELIETGKLSLPMREEDRTVCLDVKRGRYTLDVALALIDSTRERLDDLMHPVVRGASPLPDEPDMDVVNGWLTRAHLAHWAKVGG